MKTITTATGKNFDSDWCGVSSQNHLFCNLFGYTMDEIYTVFKNPDETAKILFNDDGLLYEYQDYTKLLGVQVNQGRNTVQVCLAAE